MKLVDFSTYKEEFRAPEGSVNFYYGRIGSGKTYAATADILDLLDQGFKVYANWRIAWPGNDTRTRRLRAFLGLFLGFRRQDYIPPSNFHYLDPSKEQDDIDYLAELTDCFVFIDEGQNLLDSYKGTEFSKKKRQFIQYTRHLHRTINIIAQRTQSVQVTARAQVNRFYKCERKFFPFWPRFVRKEFADIAGEDVDESDESLVSEKHYWGKKRVFRAYDSKYMRAGKPYLYPDHYRWIYSVSDTFKLIFKRASALENEFSTDRTESTPLQSVLPLKDKPAQGKKLSAFVSPETLVSEPFPSGKEDRILLKERIMSGWGVFKAFMNRPLW